MVGVKAGTFGKDDTFVTGGGLPGRDKTEGNDDEVDDPEFENLEDELLNDANKHDQDFKNMMVKLNEIDEMMSGSDLKYIKEMIDSSQQSLNTHTVGYARIKSKVNEMGEEVFKEFESTAGQLNKKDREVVKEWVRMSKNT